MESAGSPKRMIDKIEQVPKFFNIDMGTSKNSSKHLIEH